MAARSSILEDFSPFQPTKIVTRKIHEPRDERVKLPKSTQRQPHPPIDVMAKDPCESPRNPEIVDIDALSRWPRRSPSQRLAKRRVASPSTASEMSLGVLDYYLTAPSGLSSPPFSQEAPRIEAGVIDPAMEKFDFELSSTTSSRRASRPDQEPEERHAFPDTISGADKADERNPGSSPPSQVQRTSAERKETYSLFPNIEVTTPTRRSTIDTGWLVQPRNHVTPKSTTTPSHHQHPDSSYRPRKESVSSSVQSRKDSFTSFSGTRRIPMRVMPSRTSYHTTPKAPSTASNSTVSPPSRSGWSNDPITSPDVATTSGPRTSFASLLGERDSMQYPACFFEDDDDDDFGCEAVPLRKKLRWQRSPRSFRGRNASREGEFSGPKGGLGWRFARLMCCGCC